jgi:homoaconitase/3-isopropylmalate dehydratase large subunit
MTTLTIERAMLEQAKDAFAKVIEWDARRDYLIPYKVRDPVHAVQKKIDAALAAPATAPDEIERLRKDAEQMREALMFYAEGDHFTFDRDAWDTVSDEPQNYWCDEAGTATVEDGTIAKLALDAAMKG